MIYSTFSSFLTARSGISASQLGLNVTAQNMSNINTKGYTRQRIDQVSVGSYSGPQKIAMSGVSVAGGAKVTGISQLRDSYLDARFRHEMGALGELSTQHSILSELQGIIDDWDKTGPTTMLNDLLAALGAANTEGQDVDVVVRTQMELILSTLNNYGNKINDLREDVEDQLNIYVEEVNNLLEQIAELNKTIRAAQANGATDLELQDARNVLLDELSSYMDIKVTYSKDPTNPEIMDMKLEMKGEDGNWYTVMKNEDYGELSYSAGAFTMEDENGTAIAGLTSFSTGALKGMQDMLTKSGIFDGTDVNGIGYYEEMLNLFTEKFVQEINTTYVDLMQAIDPLFPATNVLIGTLDGTTNYTMGNLKIADGWRDGTYKVGNDDGLALKLSALLGEKFTFTHPVAGQVYEGTLDKFFGNIATNLAAHVLSLQSLASNKALSVNSIDDQRLSISSVSMDEETVNMMMYQKAYNASSRMMTTLDEALDTLINGTGIVGR